MQITNPEILGFSSQRLERINTVMQRYVNEKKFASILTLVSRRGSIIHLGKFGMMDLEANKPLQFDTIFRIYSMTKPITSVALLMLYEEARFNLSDPIHHFIPEFKNVKVIKAGFSGGEDVEDPIRPISILDLFTHTAGLSYGFDQNPIDDLYRSEIWKPNEKKPLERDEFIGRLTRLPLAFHPGSAFRYSLATDVLGFLVEKISDMPFEDFLMKNVFNPLGMVDTSFTVPADKLERFAANYEPDKSGGLELIEVPDGSRYRKLVGFPSGGGGLVSTAADYLRFSNFLLNKGKLEGVRLLGPKTVDLMTTNHLPEGIHPFNEPQSGFGLGVSLLLDLARGQRIDSVGNYGWSGAAATHFWVDPQEEIIGILMTQLMNNPHPIHHDFHVLVNQALIS